MKTIEPRRTRWARRQNRTTDPELVYSKKPSSVSSVVNDFRLRLFALVPAFALLASCTVGPNYVRPTADTPAAFKEMEGWKTAHPRHQTLLANGAETYNHPLTPNPQDLLSVSNPNL